MRRLGSPKTMPTAAAQSPPMMNEPSKGIPGMRNSALYAMNAPTAMNAAVPSEIWPA